VPLLRDRGIDLSASQIHRLVSGTPERLSLQVLSALCDILARTPADLVATIAENSGVRKTAIVLLYAQPVSRIVRLTINDVLHDGDQVLLRLGQPHPRSRPRSPTS
jgi:DNA-binding Xre family transcriptional regulator